MHKKKALIKTLKLNKIPFREIYFKNSKEETLMEYFTYFVLETIFIAKLIKVNPFGQNAVEQVKNNIQNFKLIYPIKNKYKTFHIFFYQSNHNSHLKNPAHFLYEELINYFF